MALTTIIKSLANFWLPNEVILYIGQTESLKSSLRRRIYDYYGTPIGEKSPHSGGKWLKTILNLETLEIFWIKEKHADFKKFIDFEKQLIDDFKEIANETPFANIRHSSNKHSVIV